MGLFKKNKSNTPAGERVEIGSGQQILILFAISLALVAIVMAVFGYKIGQKQGYRQGIGQSQSAQNTDSEGDTSSMVSKKELDAVIKERDIGLSNLEALREKNEEVHTQNLQLTQLNELLKSKIMQDGGIPLEVLGAEILSLPDSTFEYRFDVAMVAKSGEAVKMTPKLTLLNATSMVEIPLKPSSYEIKDIERIRGRFVMPDGFKPKQMKLEINAGGERKQQIYNWQVGSVTAKAYDKGLDMRPVSTTDTDKSDSKKQAN